MIVLDVLFVEMDRTTDKIEKFMSNDSNKTKFGLGQALSYSFAPARDGTIVSMELQEEVLNVFPVEEVLTYGSVETLIELLIAKDAEAWRALPEKLRTFLMRTTDWQYRVNEKTDLLNLIVNDVEIKWNGAEWVVQAFHSDFK